MFCKKNGGLIAVFIAVLVSCFIANQSKAETIEGITIATQGKAQDKGTAVIFIPGLNSGTSVFQETCDAIKSKNQCILLQLPGFAGMPPEANLDHDFLLSIHARIEAIIQQKKLKKVTLIGHSLGGTLSLMIAQHSPELVNKIVIIDALPFYSAIQNPAATVELIKPQAEQMRKAMNNQTDEDFFKNSAQHLGGMSNNPSRMSQLVEWSKTSDRATTTAAMYSMMVTDLRKSIASIQSPVLVLGSWAAYQNYGATKESTKAIFSTQYAELKNVDIQMSETGFHFLMWDDTVWVNQQITNFLKK